MKPDMIMEISEIQGLIEDLTETQELEITFTSGRGYTYNNVPENVWESFCSARSAGSYFASQIKDRY